MWTRQAKETESVDVAPIGTVAKRCGLPAKTIRYYEDIGLVTPARSDNGYRAYSNADVEVLRFLRRARGLGFSIDECRALLLLYRDSNRASADVKSIAEAHVAEIDRKLAELADLRRTLSALAAACHGDERPECPILDEIAGAQPDAGV